MSGFNLEGFWGGSFPPRNFKDYVPEIFAKHTVLGVILPLGLHQNQSRRT